MTDAIDLSTTHIVNSPDVRAWPATATINRVLFGASTGIAVEFDKAHAWPDVVAQSGPSPLQFTLWIFLNIGGQWYASGVIQFWRGREWSDDRDVTKDNKIAKDWLYDDRWFPMAGHQPIAGEHVGFMVSAGNARGVDNHVVAERSNVVAVAWPASTPAAFTFDQPQPPAPPEPPEPPAPPDPVFEFVAAVNHLYHGIEDLVSGIDTLVRRLDAIAQSGVKIHL